MTFKNKEGALESAEKSLKKIKEIFAIVAVSPRAAGLEMKKPYIFEAMVSGGDIEKQDETLDISTLGITLDSIEELDAFISNPDQEDLKELLKDQTTNEIEEEVISEKSSSLEVLVITDDVIDEDELLYSVDII
jgi:hypothetical protein